MEKEPRQKNADEKKWSKQSRYRSYETSGFEPKFPKPKSLADTSYGQYSKLLKGETCGK